MLGEKETFQTVKDIFSVGKWNNDEYTLSDLDDMVKNFDMLKKEEPAFKDGIPLKVDLFKNSKPEDSRHGGMPSCGWITEIKRVGNKLFAHIEKIPKVIKELIDTKAYKQVSAEMIWNMKRGAERLRRVLTGVALLGVEHPGVSNLEDFAKLYELKEDELQKVYIVEQQYIIQEANPMPGENKKEYEEQLKKFEDEKKQIEAEKKQIEAEKKQLEDKVKLFEAEKLEAEKKAKEMAGSQRKTEIKAFVEKKEAEGKILPAHKDAIFSVMESLDDSKQVKIQKDGKEESVSVRKQFENYIDSLTKLIEFNEKSTNGTSQEGSVDERAEELLKGFVEKPADEAGDVRQQKLAFAAKMYAEKKKVIYNDALITVSEIIKE